ncbi:MAG: hypothetical protein QOF52_1626 [Propionibacteriaceae bacterium]|jgi:hypothetical protein|nr:hypothetical protein [Propionibacteriaceae bacterium]
MDVLAFDDGTVGQGPDQCWPAGSRPAREQLWGLDEAGVRQNLASTTPDPLAAPVRQPRSRRALPAHND